MSSFAPNPSTVKSDSYAAYDSEDAVFFPHIKPIKFEGKDSKNYLAFKHYNAEEVVGGKKMKDHLRFSVCYWHTFRGTGADPFGFPTLIRPWDDSSNSMANAKRRVRAAFEFFVKLGVEYYTFHDRDVAPEGSSVEETNKNLDEITDLMLDMQKKTGVKLLWGTANLFSAPRYMNGAATSPDAHAFAFAAQQVKKAMDLTLKLGGVNYVFWGGREGYMSVLNTDIKREMDHMATFFRMAVEYKKKIGATFQFLIEPKPREPTKSQYDYDTRSVMAFLYSYGLQEHFKVNIEPNHTTLAGHDFEHDIIIASQFGFLGSIDSNTGDQALGWDTDQFPMDVKKATLLAQVLLKCNGGKGLAPGGLNFDCKVRRESTELDDLFIGHIGAMDTFARGLKAAYAIEEDGILAAKVKERYSSFDSGIGAKVEEGTTSFEELEAYVLTNGDAHVKSGKQELFEMILNGYM